jgi:tetratricopeptide (TPR) repeat protein
MSADDVPDGRPAPDRRFFGVGTSTYTDPAFEELPAAADDVRRVADRLAEEGFEVSTVLDEPKAVVQSRLGTDLAGGAATPGSSLIVLWSGHANLNAALASVSLFAADDPRSTTTATTLAQVAAGAAQTGASQLLLMLDACRSGQTLMDAAAVLDRVGQALPDQSDRWVAVVASCQDHERAVDGAFAKKLLELLESGPRDPVLRLRWSSYQAGLRGDDLIDALIREWDEGRQLPKQVSSGSPWLIMANPLYRAGAPDRVVEHLLWAARGGARGEKGNWFTGREEHLRTLVGWMAAAEPGLTVITGPAGCGKSALAGRLISLSNPDERAQIADDGQLPAADLDPGEGSIAAHVQARGLTLEACAELLAGTLGVPSLGTPNEHDVLSWARSLDGPPPVIVVDGLDEAGAEAPRIAEGLLAELSGRTRLIVATREVPGSGTDPSLLQRLGPPALQIDLGPGEDGEDPDLPLYVVRRLTDRKGVRLSTIMDPDRVAEEIAALTSQSLTAGRDGGFLLARVLTSQLIARPVDTNLDGWQSQLATTVEQAFQQDLIGVRALKRDDVEIPNAAQDLLTALSYSYGPGFPTDDVWPAVAGAISEHGTTYERLDAFWVLDEHGRYVTASSLDGQAVYRLHHRLAEWLRSNAEPDARLRVATAILGEYERFLRAGHEASDHPYLWQFAWRHAVDGGGQAITQLMKLAELDAALLPDVPQALNALGIMYSQHGRDAEAVAPTETAVRIYERLAEASPSNVKLLAGALNNLGIRYNNVGRYDEAIESTERAVELFRQLAAENPAYLGDLAGALTNLGVSYSDFGRLHDAIPPTREAVEISERLATDNPTSMNDLAGALNNLGNRYDDVGRHADAIAPTERAVEIRAKLVEESPAYLHDYASSLNNLGNRYGNVGQHLKAIDPIGRAVEIFRKLAADNAAFTSHLASSLTNLSVNYNDVGRPQDAVEPIERAVVLFEQLADANPAAYLNNLATALTNLGNAYSNVGRHPDAVPPTERAVEIRKQLAATNPDAYLNDLAGSLSSLGNRYGEVGRHMDAVPPTERAVEIREQLAASDPEAYVGSLAGSLTNLGNRYSNVGRLEDAVAPSVRATELFEQLAADNPVYLNDLAGSLTNLGIRYADVGRFGDATDPIERAVEIREQLVTTNPAFLPYLASSLTNLGTNYGSLGREQDAVLPTERAIEIYEQLSAENRAYLHDLGTALNNLGTIYGDFGRDEDAARTMERATGILEELAADNPAYLASLATALSNLGHSYGKLGRHAEALPPSTRSLDLIEELALDNIAYLGSLATAANTFLDITFELGRAEEGRRRWDEVLSAFATKPAAAVRLRLSRSYDPDDIEGPLHDLLEAVAQDPGDDPGLTAIVHARCRDLRRSGDTDSFDARWPGERPGWLLLTDETLQTFQEWIETPTWMASRDFLETHADRLLADDGSVALEEIRLLLVQDEGLVDRHQLILDEARSAGIDRAYRGLEVIDLASAWMQIDDLQESASYLAEHLDALVSDGAVAFVAHREDAVRFAILTLARAGHADQAFDLLTGQDDAAASLAAFRRGQDSGLYIAVTVLALARATTAEDVAAATVNQVIAATLAGMGNPAAEQLSKLMASAPDTAPLIQAVTDAMVHHPEKAEELARLIQQLTAG